MASTDDELQLCAAGNPGMQFVLGCRYVRPYNRGILLMTLLVKTRSLKTYSWNISSGAACPASATRSREMFPLADCTCRTCPDCQGPAFRLFQRCMLVVSLGSFAKLPEPGL